MILRYIVTIYCYYIIEEEAEEEIYEDVKVPNLEIESNYSFKRIIII